MISIPLARSHTPMFLHRLRNKSSLQLKVNFTTISHRCFKSSLERSANNGIFFMKSNMAYTVFKYWWTRGNGHGAFSNGRGNIVDRAMASIPCSKDPGTLVSNNNGFSVTFLRLSLLPELDIGTVNTK